VYSMGVVQYIGLLQYTAVVQGYRNSSGVYWYISTTGVQELYADTGVLQRNKGTGIIEEYRCRTGVQLLYRTACVQE